MRDDAHQLAETLNKEDLTASDIYDSIITNIENRYKTLFEG
jgi:hypothetical protein